MFFRWVGGLKGSGRKRIQQPHHRVLAKKQLVKRNKDLEEEPAEKPAESAAKNKTVSVSGALGPFSLLLQVHIVIDKCYFRCPQNILFKVINLLLIEMSPA